MITDSVSDSDDVLSVGWDLLSFFLQCLCLILGLSRWVGAHVLLLLVPGDDSMDNGGEGGMGIHLVSLISLLTFLYFQASLMVLVPLSLVWRSLSGSMPWRSFVAEQELLLSL